MLVIDCFVSSFGTISAATRVCLGCEICYTAEVDVPAAQFALSLFCAADDQSAQISRLQIEYLRILGYRCAQSGHFPCSGRLVLTGKKRH